MALNEQAKFLYEGVNTALEDATGWFSQYIKPTPKNVNQMRQATGVGVIQYPRGSGIEVNGSPPPPPARPAVGLSLDRANTAIKFNNATRRLTIPRNQQYTGIAPEAIGVPPAGAVILTALQDERTRFGTNNNNSGWGEAVASYRSIDATDFTTRRTDPSAPNADLPNLTQ
jgi:hypothetical protein